MNLLWINKRQLLNVWTPTRVEYEFRAGMYYLWGSNGYNECCLEDNDVTKYVFETSDCKEILDIV